MSLLLLFSLNLATSGVVEVEQVTPGRVYIPTQYRGETEAQKLARRLAQGILQPTPRVLPTEKAEQTLWEPAPLDLTKYLAAVQQALADNAAQRADIAAKQARARVEASLARHAATQTRLAAEHQAAQQLEAAIMLQIEETDVAFVAALLMEV